MSFSGVLVNGVEFDHSSLEVSFDGVPVQSVSEISCSQSLEPGTRRGTSAAKLGRSRGPYNAEGSFTVSRADYKILVAQLSAKGLGGYGEAPFTITMTFFEVGSDPAVTVVRGCRITNDDFSSSAGSDVAMVTASIDVMQILVDGQSMVSPRGQS